MALFAIRLHHADSRGLFCRHEDLYESIQHRLIRSDELIADPVDVEHRIGGATTILCTAAMLSNPALDKCAVFRLVPVERLIVDEVSQIDSFEFMVNDILLVVQSEADMSNSTCFTSSGA